MNGFTEPYYFEVKKDIRVFTEFGGGKLMFSG